MAATRLLGADEFVSDGERTLWLEQRPSWRKVSCQVWTIAAVVIISLVAATEIVAAPALRAQLLDEPATGVAMAIAAALYCGFFLSALALCVWKEATATYVVTTERLLIVHRQLFGGPRVVRAARADRVIRFRLEARGPPQQSGAALPLVAPPSAATWPPAATWQLPASPCEGCAHWIPATPATAVSALHTAEDASVISDFFPACPGFAHVCDIQGMVAAFIAAQVGSEGPLQPRRFIYVPWWVRWQRRGAGALASVLVLLLPTAAVRCLVLATAGEALCMPLSAAVGAAFALVHRKLAAERARAIQDSAAHPATHLCGVVTLFRLRPRVSVNA